MTGGGHLAALDEEEATLTDAGDVSVTIATEEGWPVDEQPSSSSSSESREEIWHAVKITSQF